MLLTIGADGNRLEDQVSKRFGHANFYIIYNTELKNFVAVKNNVNDHTQSSLYDLLNSGSKTFIVGNIGPNAFDLLNTENSEIYLARRVTVQEALKNFLKGKLKKLKAPTLKRSIGNGHHH